MLAAQQCVAAGGVRSCFVGVSAGRRIGSGGVVEVVSHQLGEL